MTEDQAAAYEPDPLTDALSVPFVSGPKGECALGGCTADLDALPVVPCGDYREHGRRRGHALGINYTVPVCACGADRADHEPVIDDHEFIDSLNDWQGEP